MKKKAELLKYLRRQSVNLGKFVSMDEYLDKLKKEEKLCVEGEYEEERANMDVKMFCELNEVSARMLFCHKQDEDDDLPHGQLS